MKDLSLILSICLAVVMLYALGVWHGVLYEKHRNEPGRDTPEFLVRKVVELYTKDVMLPDSVMIGFQSGNQAYIFRYCDSERGLEYVGLFEEVER